MSGSPSSIFPDSSLLFLFVLLGVVSQAVPTYISTIAARYDLLKAVENGETLSEDLVSAVPDAPQSLWMQLSATLRLLATDDKLVMMVPLFIYIGVEQAFFFSVFGSRLVAPTFGDAMVGTISIGFGVTNAVCSPFLGKLADMSGWPAPMALGLGFHVCALGVVMAWRAFGLIEIKHNTYGIIIMCVLFGCSSLTRCTQIVANCALFSGKYSACIHESCASFITHKFNRNFDEELLRISPYPPPFFSSRVSAQVRSGGCVGCWRCCVQQRNVRYDRHVLPARHLG